MPILNTKEVLLTSLKRPINISCIVLSITIILFSAFLFHFNKMGVIIYTLLLSAIVMFLSSLIENNNKDNHSISIRNPIILLMPMVIVFIGFSLYTKDIINYFNFSPLWAVDELNRWHQDSAFNISLIRGIINWGYPTVGLNGHPLSTYHVLSHYVDAALLTISGLDPYESYGFTSLVKSCFYTYLIFILLYKRSQNSRNGIVLFFVASPLIIASWHAMISHALWFTSYIVIASSSFVYNVLTSNNRTSWQEYIKLTCICLILSAGKISTGLSFTCIIFASLIFKEYKNKLFYISAIVALIFFALYQKFINYSYGIGSNIELSNISVKNILNAFSTPKYSSVMLFMAVILYLSSKVLSLKAVKRVSFGIFSSYITIILINTSFTSFNINDRYYFYYGVYSISILLVINSFIDAIKNDDSNVQASLHTNKNRVIVYCLLSILSFFIYQPLVSLSTLSTFRSKEISEQKSVIYQLIGEMKMKDTNGKLYNLVSFTNKVLQINGVNKSDVALFIPKDIINNQIIKPDEMREKFYTMNIFAATGVQLINGFINGGRAYGLANYTDDSKPTNSIDMDSICKKMKLKGVITVLDYNSSKFNYRACN
ncbi:hypothetical protein ACM26M_15480 [Kluyvera cryocrescens]|uniref:hypothetical protein n=1 Tax=Kluyvera cryocrescens TaxID=580 RepID=UPI0039F6956B